MNQFKTKPPRYEYDIKTHGSVSCGPRKRGTRKLREYINRNNKVAIFTHLYKVAIFTHLYSVVFYLINPKVAVDVPAYQRRLHTKFEKKIAQSVFEI